MKAALLSVLATIALLAPAAGQAQPDPRLAALEAAFNRVQAEQQSVYQQFQMAQELRRNELREPNPNDSRNYSMGADAPRPVDYDANQKLLRERQERLQRYERDINQSYARYQELGVQKKALLDQIIELSVGGKR